MPTPKGGRQSRGVSLSPKGAREVQWQMDCRCWTKQDYADLAGVHYRTVENYLAGRRVDRVTVALLEKTRAEHPPIPGLAEILEKVAS